MTRELGPTARSLLAAARQGLAPDAATAARVRARVGRAIAVGERVAIATTALKIVAVLALAAAAVTTIGVVVRRPSPAVHAPSIALAAGEARNDLAPAVRSTAAEASPPRAPVAAPVIETHPTAPDVPSLAREVELVDRAMASLAGGDPDGALATIAAYDRETAGYGQLAEDAAAIAIEAHCARHDSVTIELDDFDRQWPSSAQRSRLAAACAP